MCVQRGAASDGMCGSLRRVVAVRSADLFHVPQWSLYQSSAGHMVLLRDGYPVAQGNLTTLCIHPSAPLLIREMLNSRITCDQ